MLKITGSSYLSESILLSLFISVDGAPNRVSIKAQCSVVFCEESSSRWPVHQRSRSFMCLCALVFCKDCAADRILCVQLDFCIELIL